jgi:TetR/AcrR family transcriptional regulator
MGIAERKEREKQQRRDEIIHAAEKVFISRGFKNATMEDIADEAELSKGTLYLYFNSKEELHLAVARNAMILLRSHTSGAAGGEGNALEKLQRMGWSCVDFSRTHPDHMKAIMTLEEMETGSISMSVTEIREMIYRESTVGTVIEVVEQGVAEKLIRDDIPAVIIAHTLWMSVLSVVRFVSNKAALLEMLDITPDQIFRSQFELVLNGIRS